MKCLQCCLISSASWFVQISRLHRNKTRPLSCIALNNQRRFELIEFIYRALSTVKNLHKSSVRVCYSISVLMWQQNYKETPLKWSCFFYEGPRLWIRRKWTISFVLLLRCIDVHHLNVKWLLLTKLRPWVKRGLIVFNLRQICSSEVFAFFFLDFSSNNLSRDYPCQPLGNIPF